MNIVESTIPPNMTIEQWRQLRRGSTVAQRNPWSLLLVAARRVARHGTRACDHLHDTAGRYDHAAKRLELLLTCSVCKTEKVIHSLAYEPRFEPSRATVHPLRQREGETRHAPDRAASAGLLTSSGDRRRAGVRPIHGSDETIVSGG